VDPPVHRVASEVWPHAEHLAIDLLHDSVIGYRLLKRAVAAVSGLPADKREQIRDLPAYLFQTYKRLVLAELEKQNRHRTSDVAASELFRPFVSEADRIDRDILIAELVRAMAPWTRDVFEALTLGYSFEEIARAMDSNPQVVRNRFRLAVRKLANAVRATASSPLNRTARPHRVSSSTFARLRMMRARLLNPSRSIRRRGRGSS
jgi:DNA-directed RNA polymerase specialized sigma24 family protein